MNDNVTIADFQDWINSPVGCLVLSKLTEQASEYNKLDSSLAEKAVFRGDIESLQSLGLDSAIRMATVRGIELFTDIDALADELFKEKPGADNV